MFQGYKTIGVCALGMLALTLFLGTARAQSTVSITGTVVDSTTTTAIANALVKWAELPQCTTRTNSSGAFTLAYSTVQSMRPFQTGVAQGSVAIMGNILSIAGLTPSAKVAIRIFAMNGTQIFRSERAATAAGSIEFSGMWHTPGIYLVSINITGKEYHAISSGMSRISFPIAGNRPETLAKSTATYTMQVAANGYVTKNIPMVFASGNAGTIRLLKSTAQMGVWTNVTPSSLNLDGNYAGQAANYGATVILADPVRPGIIYAFACYQGCWRSTDYGATWTKFNAGNGFFGTNPDGMDISRPVGGAIAQDGSYMIIAPIYPMTPPNANPQNEFYKKGGEFISSVYISRENGPDSALGKYWTRVDTKVMKPIRVAIDPTNKNHVALTAASSDLLESMDGGFTWHTTPGILPGETCELFFLGSNVLFACVPNDGGSYRGVKVGTTFPWTWTFTRITSQSPGHTMYGIYIDTVNNHLYFPGSAGIDRSSDLTGSSWSRLCTGTSRIVVATATRFYAGDAFPTGGFYYAGLKSASRSSESVWVNQTIPAAMTNGPTNCKVLFDGQHYILVSGNWLAGFWRYIEP